MPGTEEHQIALLTLIASVAIEEVVVDWLLENAPDIGFCSGPVNGHSASHDSLTLAEQVSGRKRQVRFELHGATSRMDAIVEKIRQDLSGATIHYWIAPLARAGKV